MQQEHVIIVAGGTGSRMQSDIPKQFIEVGHEAIIIRTIKAFLNYNAAIQIIICVHKNFKTYLEELCAKNNLTNIKITLGGDTRFQSVKNGLDLVTDETVIVGIHDAARPFASMQTIKNCFNVAKEKGNAIPCVTISESLRNVNAQKNTAVNRNEFKTIQTPQCFLASKIKKAFLQEYNSSFTDDATVLESIGEKINLVEGNIENIKITTKFDLAIAKALLHNE
ncbi:MAG TPA: 2-C-methyl-D-erythritol 4-phosphate cytidylyltransferase [Chitinophagaceae bacterium]|nr:2-C-methyl-D-erythritol 4-phosphate cytidylyltransferase [Bacteroidota bacterium]HEV8081001.1 2-C-methyl-D-erythritol 4-phosphate cytidylyltransferase [Chitinophagaceae bacterium]